ncbi:MAG: hypothetical protein ACK5YR_09510 [Pirellula sp.]
MPTLKNSCGCLAAIPLFIVGIVGAAFLFLQLGANVERENRESREAIERRFLPSYQLLGIVVQLKDGRNHRISYALVKPVDISNKWQVLALIGKIYAEDPLLDEVRLVSGEDGFNESVDQGFVEQWFLEKKYVRTNREFLETQVLPLSKESLKLFPNGAEPLKQDFPSN